MSKHEVKFNIRTQKCNHANASQVGARVVLNGWVRRRRDHGGVIFVDLGDYTGCTQVVFQPDKGKVFELAQSLRSEYVISVSGVIRMRPEGARNTAIMTGEIELEATELTILSMSEPVPFPIQDDIDASEDVRLRYRFLDIRRPQMQKILRIRHRVCRAAREYLDDLGFCEIETPILTKTTPEGARDFLVPCRFSHGQFYALPQSPQLFKQILMCAGMDRYYQIVRCFRDEDFRANRQPEFTQIDLELSFVDEEIIMGLIEGLVVAIWDAASGVSLEVPFMRLSYDDAMDRFGVDAPDMRFGMELVDLSSVFKEADFRVFRDIVEAGGVVKGICLEAGAELSRKELDELANFVATYGVKGLSWIKCESGKFTSPIAKFLDEGMFQRVGDLFEVRDGDAILIAAGSFRQVGAALGALRVHLAKTRGLIEDESQLSFAWITEFPLFEYEEETKRYLAVHHPFTSPLLVSENDRENFRSAPHKLKARAYDLVLNGQEIGGGSIRIHDRDVQSRVFELLGITPSEAEAKFGFLLNAFTFGAPPHGGIALGLDRLIMLISGATSIRDVIAFPKTASGVDLMVDAPSPANEAQLEELGLKLADRVREQK